MDQIKLKQLREIHDNTRYMGCAFYLDEARRYEFENVIFQNCSFRSKVSFYRIKNYQFVDCNFSEKLSFDFSRANLNQLPEEMLQLPAITHLELYNNQLTELPKNIENLQTTTP